MEESHPLKGVLTDRETTALLLLVGEGLSFRATAREMNCSPRTVQRLKNAGTAKLSVALDGKVGEFFKPAPPNEEIPGRPAPMRIQWSTCVMCDAVCPTEDTYCDRCDTVAVATAVAFRS